MKRGDSFHRIISLNGKHDKAGDLYDEEGIAAFQKLWNVLKSHHELLDDAAFAQLLFDEVDESVANVPLRWNE